MSHEPLDMTIDPSGVATVTLCRPAHHNALNGELIEALTQTAARLGADDAVRVVVLTGEGASFCAGGDIGWFRASVALDRVGRIAESRKLADMLDALDRMPKPLIGKINGQAFGGGTGLIAVCDLAIGLADSRFGLTEVRLGLTPANISPYVVRKIGASKARAFMLSGARFDGTRAAGLGLIDEACTTGAALDLRVREIVSDHLEASPQAVAATKAMIAQVAGRHPGDLKDYTAAQLADAWETRDGRVGIDCFLEKRRPPWRSGGATA